MLALYFCYKMGYTKNKFVEALFYERERETVDTCSFLILTEEC